MPWCRSPLDDRVARMRGVVVLVMLVLPMSVPAVASDKRGVPVILYGKDLREICGNEKSVYDAAYCRGLVNGFSQGVRSGDAASNSAPRICWPDARKSEPRKLEVLRAYLDKMDATQAEYLRAEEVMYRAFLAEWPCHAPSEEPAPPALP